MPLESEIRGDRTARFPVAGQATAGTADEFTLMKAPAKLAITGVSWVPKAAVTADGTNYCTVTVRNRKADASGTAKPASRSYAATNSVAFVAEAMTLSATAADLVVAKGDVLTCEKLVAGTGLAMPGGTVEITYRLV